MVWPPTLRELVVTVATPPLSVTLPPIWLLPSKKLTRPVGVMLPEFGVTVAVKVTLCPKKDGLPDPVTFVVVVVAGAGVIDWLKMGLLLLWKLPSVVKVAVI